MKLLNGIATTSPASTLPEMWRARAARRGGNARFATIGPHAVAEQAGSPVEQHRP